MEFFLSFSSWCGNNDTINNIKILKLTIHCSLDLLFKSCHLLQLERLSLMLKIQIARMYVC